MTQKSLNRIEGFGLILILLSFGWQVFKDDLVGISQKNDFYLLHEKIDNFWNVYSEDFSKRFPEKGPIIHTDFQYLSSQWKPYSEHLKINQKLEGQIRIFSTIAIVFFVIGSVLIIIPKYTSTATR